MKNRSAPAAIVVSNANSRTATHTSAAYAPALTNGEEKRSESDSKANASAFHASVFHMLSLNCAGTATVTKAMLTPSVTHRKSGSSGERMRIARLIPAYSPAVKIVKPPSHSLRSTHIRP